MSQIAKLRKMCWSNFNLVKWRLIYTVSCAFAGACTVHNVHCAVCMVQCAACQRWKFSSWKQEKSNLNFTFQIMSQKLITLTYFLKTGLNFWFLKAWNQKPSLSFICPKSIILVILHNTSFWVQNVCQINILGYWY